MGGRVSRLVATHSHVSVSLSVKPKNGQSDGYRGMVYIRRATLLAERGTNTDGQESMVDGTCNKKARRTAFYGDTVGEMMGGETSEGNPNPRSEPGRRRVGRLRHGVSRRCKHVGGRCRVRLRSSRERAKTLIVCKTSSAKRPLKNEGTIATD
jgi:hypothetical protein